MEEVNSDDLLFDENFNNSGYTERKLVFHHLVGMVCWIHIGLVSLSGWLSKGY
jgi:hypothetical protein